MDLLFTERLRPKNLKQIILLDRIRNSIGGNPLSQHLLLTGPKGVGKSSIAHIISQGYPTLKINASSARGIDTVRDTIVPHCSTLSFGQSVDDNLKIVFLDEFDNATKDFYDAMRGTIEQYSDNVRFIATCNYPNKITPEVRDRFLELNFTPQNKTEENELFEKYKNRILKLSEKLNIQWDSDEVINKFIWNLFPSFRKIISSIQNFVDSNTLNITKDDVIRASYSFSDLFDFISQKQNPYEIYQFILSDYSNKIDEVLESLGTEFPKWIKENKPDKSNIIGGVCIYSAEWLYKKAFMVDPVLALNACIFQVNQLFK
jgi:DNA polymerase III delta prime subunit